MAPKRKNLGRKICVVCGVEYKQKRYTSGPDGSFKNRKYCSRLCAGKSFRVSVPAKTRLRGEALAAYGGQCACCGESTEEFLTIDHIHNDGAKHRREVGSSGVPGWAKKNGYPNSLQVLCWNCNMAKALYGVCPHEQTNGTFPLLRGGWRDSGINPFEPQNHRGGGNR